MHGETLKCANILFSFGVYDDAHERLKLSMRN